MLYYEESIGRIDVYYVYDTNHVPYILMGTTVPTSNLMYISLSSLYQQQSLLLFYFFWNLNDDNAVFSVSIYLCSYCYYCFQFYKQEDHNHPVWEYS